MLEKRCSPFVLRRLGALLTASCLCLLAPRAPLAAQAPRIEIRGLVLAGDSLRVPSATVTLMPGAAVVRTNAQGRFSFRSVAPGTYQVIVRSLGFPPDTSQVLVGSTNVVELVVTLQSPLLERVSVSAVRAGLPRVADRERRGLGAVMYADEIAKSTLYQTADLLHFTPRLLIGNRTNVRYLERVYVDGRLIRDSSDIPDKRDIAAIEAHRGYMGMRETDLWIPSNEHPLSSARIVLIWTLQYMVREQKQR